MAITNTEYAFYRDGKLVRRDITEREIRITPDMIQGLQSDVYYKCGEVALHEKWGSLSLCIGHDAVAWWTVNLPRLSIKAPWVMKGEYWVPDLTAADAPVTAMNWDPPADMRLVFLVPTLLYGVGDVRKHGHSYLFAYYLVDNSTYRLPMGNLYDECRVCLGQEEFRDTSHMRCVAKVMEQFENSAWNADLWSTRGPTQRLFAFKPSNEGFDQVKVRNWMENCKKIGNTVSERVVL